MEGNTSNVKLKELSKGREDGADERNAGRRGAEAAEKPSGNLNVISRYRGSPDVAFPLLFPFSNATNKQQTNTRSDTDQGGIVTRARPGKGSRINPYLFRRRSRSFGRSFEIPDFPERHSLPI